MKNNEDGLFPALEAVLKKATQPLDCQTLFDMPEIKAHAASANRVSDYLGGMWRKGQVVRTHATKTDANNRSRWAYSWKGHRGPKLYDPEAIEYTPKILADRPTCLITEEGNAITIELPNLIISIRQKPQP